MKWDANDYRFLIQSIVENNSLEYFITGFYRQSTNKADVFIMKINNDGDLIWKKKISFPLDKDFNEFPSYLKMSNDNTKLFLGINQTNSNNSPNPNYYICSFNPNDAFPTFPYYNYLVQNNPSMGYTIDKLLQNGFITTFEYDDSNVGLSILNDFNRPDVSMDCLGTGSFELQSWTNNVEWVPYPFTLESYNLLYDNEPSITPFTADLSREQPCNLGINCHCGNESYDIKILSIQTSDCCFDIHINQKQNSCPFSNIDVIDYSTSPPTIVPKTIHSSSYITICPENFIGSKNFIFRITMTDGQYCEIEKTIKCACDCDDINLGISIVAEPIGKSNDCCQFGIFIENNIDCMIKGTMTNDGIDPKTLYLAKGKTPLPIYTIEVCSPLVATPTITLSIDGCQIEKQFELKCEKNCCDDISNLIINGPTPDPNDVVNCCYTLSFDISNIDCIKSMKIKDQFGNGINTSVLYINQNVINFCIQKDNYPDLNTLSIFIVFYNSIDDFNPENIVCTKPAELDISSCNTCCDNINSTITTSASPNPNCCMVEITFSNIGSSNCWQYAEFFIEDEMPRRNKNLIYWQLVHPNESLIFEHCIDYAKRYHVQFFNQEGKLLCDKTLEISCGS
ncbi:MAG: hypothetical protein A2X61_03585 [Ignavibacteria bacterium GWB2_35_12]|nr:MAG: hypothetical protein A2X63_00745 [Ignavibacteria bacterium GWA2_35_8]OGU40368.1 MAG: hypothetical protein A2X61_03585 [Ignavibacteria bacterium GWB2_35_12]OGU92161.1 MAG: hypothetical protein A2220_13525 [Ignavibacteria bacterium RIFOXYA2_FULL_35_10]OGV22504.1 MAG: hypothetical protein A2475_03260 [Ignavibacteria bacterium RIFOXYC2_FULL_35_21]